MDKNGQKKSEYEKMQLRWMLDHDCSLSDLLKELDEERQNHHPQESLLEVFKDWEMNSGFSGMIWPCEKEAEDAGELDCSAEL